MSNILLISHTFAPDGVSSAVLMGELASELQKAGHSLTVLTSTPHYNNDPDARARQPLHRRCGGLFYVSEHNGIAVYHASVPAKRSGLGCRLLDIVRFHVISTLIGLVLVRRHDLMLVPSPPLTIGLCAWILKLFSRRPFIYTVQEIYPDVAVKLGVLRNRRVIRLLEKLEMFIYRRAHVVTVISERFRQLLLQKGVPPEKLVVIPNFVDTDFIQPGERQNRFSEEHRLGDRFVVLYAGNIGLTQSFDSILAAARLLSEITAVTFLIVGNGSRRRWLEEQLASGHYANVKLLPYQPRSRVPQIYATADLCLVPLKRGTAQDTFPSKIYTIMAAARPAIAAADSNSELADLVTRAGCGWCVEPDNAAELARVIRRAYRDRESVREKGVNGRHYVTSHYARQRVTAQYDAHIRQLADAKTLGGLVRTA